MIDSKKPTAPKYGFGTSDRKNRKRVFDGEAIAKIDLAGQTGNGPASYFPTKEVLIAQDKSRIVVERENTTEKFKYSTVCVIDYFSATIGQNRQRRTRGQRERSVQLLQQLERLPEAG